VGAVHSIIFDRDSELCRPVYFRFVPESWRHERRRALARQGLRRLHDVRHREMHVGEHIIRREPALGNVAHG
jgi:hypothetical protein